VLVNNTAFQMTRDSILGILQRIEGPDVRHNIRQSQCHARALIGSGNASYVMSAVVTTSRV
jgi:hypothetical protein